MRWLSLSTMSILLLPSLASAQALAGNGTLQDPWRLPADLDTLPQLREAWHVGNASLLDGQKHVSQARAVAAQEETSKELQDQQSVDLLVLDVANGKTLFRGPKWLSRVTNRLPGIVLTTAEAVVLAIDGHGLLGVDARTGKVRWRLDDGWAQAWQGRVVMEQADGTRLLDAETGKLVWRGPKLVRTNAWELNDLEHAPQLTIGETADAWLGVDRDGKPRQTLKKAVKENWFRTEWEQCVRVGDLAYNLTSTGLITRAQLPEGAVCFAPHVTASGSWTLWRTLDLQTIVRFGDKPTDPPQVWRLPFPPLDPQRSYSRELGLDLARDTVLRGEENSVAGFALTPPYDPPRREAIPLNRDIVAWMETALGRTLRDDDGACRDAGLEGVDVKARLTRLPLALWQPPLLQFLAKATSADLEALAPLTCTLSPEQHPEALEQAWKQRWIALTAGLSPVDWSRHLNALGSCQQLRPALEPLALEMLHRQPWTSAWAFVRLQVLRNSPAPTPELAQKWAVELAAALEMAVGPRDGGETRADFNRVAQAFHEWAELWPGLPDVWTQLAARLRMRGPAQVCPRVVQDDYAIGPCIREPPATAWTSSADGWTVFTALSSREMGNEIWAMRWQGGVWHGPWFVMDAPEGETGPGCAFHVREDPRWIRPQEDGKTLGWKLDPPDPGCDPKVLERLKAVKLPPSVAWASLAVDSDGDGWSDKLEARLGTNPQLADSDGDGTPDPLDPAPGCAREAESNANAAAWGAWALWRADPSPVRFSPAAHCADVATAGGPLLPPGPGKWREIREAPASATGDLAHRQRTRPIRPDVHRSRACPPRIWRLAWPSSRERSSRHRPRGEGPQRRSGHGGRRMSSFRLALLFCMLVAPVSLLAAAPPGPHPVRPVHERGSLSQLFHALAPDGSHVRLDRHGHVSLQGADGALLRHVAMGRDVAAWSVALDPPRAWLVDENGALTHVDLSEQKAVLVELPNGTLARTVACSSGQTWLAVLTRGDHLLRRNLRDGTWQTLGRVPTDGSGTAQIAVTESGWVAMLVPDQPPLAWSPDGKSQPLTTLVHQNRKGAKAMRVFAETLWLDGEAFQLGKDGVRFLGTVQRASLDGCWATMQGLSCLDQVRDDEMLTTLVPGQPPSPTPPPALPKLPSLTLPGAEAVGLSDDGKTLAVAWHNGHVTAHVWPEGDLIATAPKLSERGIVRKVRVVDGGVEVLRTGILHDHDGMLHTAWGAQTWQTAGREQGEFGGQSQTLHRRDGAEAWPVAEGVMVWQPQHAARVWKTATPGHLTQFEGKFLVQEGAGTTLLDLATERQVVLGAECDIKDVEFSPNGKRMAYTNQQGLLCVLDTASGGILACRAGLERPKFSVRGDALRVEGQLVVDATTLKTRFGERWQGEWGNTLLGWQDELVLVAHESAADEEDVPGANKPSVKGLIFEAYSLRTGTKKPLTSLPPELRVEMAAARRLGLPIVDGIRRKNGKSVFSDAGAHADEVRLQSLAPPGAKLVRVGSTTVVWQLPASRTLVLARRADGKAFARLPGADGEVDSAKRWLAVAKDAPALYDLTSGRKIADLGVPTCGYRDLRFVLGGTHVVGRLWGPAALAITPTPTATEAFEEGNWGRVGIPAIAPWPPAPHSWRRLEAYPEADLAATRSWAREPDGRAAAVMVAPGAKPYAKLEGSTRETYSVGEGPLLVAVSDDAVVRVFDDGRIGRYRPPVGEGALYVGGAFPHSTHVVVLQAREMLSTAFDLDTSTGEWKTLGPLSLQPRYGSDNRRNLCNVSDDGKRIQCMQGGQHVLRDLASWRVLFSCMRLNETPLYAHGRLAALGCANERGGLTVFDLERGGQARLTIDNADPPSAAWLTPILSRK